VREQQGFSLSRRANTPFIAILRVKQLIIKMTNNDILKKLRVALKLRNDEIVEIRKLVDFEVSKSELDALIRDESHRNYREAGDQVLRNFLNGLIIHLRGPKEEQ